MKNTLLLLAALSLFSCHRETGLNLRAYYYPLDGLGGDGKVYCYESSINEQDPPFYWHLQTLEEDGKTYLQGTYYDHRFLPFQYFKEEVFSNGTKLRDFRLYEYDSLGQQYEVPVDIEGGNVFPFRLKDSLAVLYTKLSWKNTLDPATGKPVPPEEQATTTLIRNRQYAGDTTYTVQGQSYQAVHFYVRELIDVESEGHIEQEYDGGEIYARDLGLVFFVKNVTPEFKIAYRLQKVITYENFHNMMK